MSHGFIALLVVRFQDTLPLCSYTEPNYASSSEAFRTQMQKILSKMQSSRPAGMPVEGSERQYTSFDEEKATYFVLMDPSNNLSICAAVNKLLVRQVQKQACAVLDAVCDEFLKAVGGVGPVSSTAVRGFAFIKHDGVLQRTVNSVVANQYRSSPPEAPTGGASQEHYETIKQELSDVRVVIRKNLDDLLTRGERLDVMSQYSAQLKHQSGNYYKKTVRMNRMRVLKTYGPPIVVILFILMFLYWKYF